MPPIPGSISAYIDQNADKFIGRLAKAVAIPSVSGDAAYRKHVYEMADWIEQEMKALGIQTKQVPVGTQVLEGKEIKLPNVVLGTLGNDKSKKTVLLYGHFDVQPALKSDGWDTDPFTLVQKEDGRLVGRGSSDDKGPILGWFNAIEAYQKTGTPIPVNLKFCFEGMEESGSEGLDDLVKAESKKGGYFDGVDCACISDNYWMNTRTPVLTYGLRGLAYYRVTISGPGRDLHSGVFGGTVHEPMTDLIALLSKLVDNKGRILIPGVNELVAPLTEEERARYEGIDYSVQDVESAAGGPVALSQDKATVLMGRMRYPTLSIHGIEGAFSAPGAKTVIPARVSGKFSLRLVPDQTPENIAPLVQAYVESEFAKLNTRNKLEFADLHGGKPWVTDPDHWNYRAASRATETVYRQKPDLNREGGSIPITLTFADALGVNVLLLPMGRGDDGAHSTNEKLDRRNFVEGSKLLGTYLWEVGHGEE